MSRNRTAGAVLAALLSLANFVVALVLLPMGSQDMAAAGDQPPYGVVVMEVVLGVLGLVAAWGAWKAQRWGVLLTIGVMALNVLISLPGIAFAPTVSSKLTSGLAIVVAGASIWLLLRREPRRVAV